MSKQTWRQGMTQTFKFGLAGGLIGAIGLFVGSALGAQVSSVGLSAAAGVALALIRVGSPLERLIGFLIGLALGVLYMYMQLGALPGGATTLGNAVAIGIVVLVVTVITALTRRRISAWSMLLGVFAYVSAMLAVVQSSPGTAVYQVPVYVMSVLGASLVGFLTVIPVELFSHTKPKSADGTGEAVSLAPTPAPDDAYAPVPAAPAEPNAGIQILDGGK